MNADNSLDAFSVENNQEQEKVVMNLGYNIIASTQNKNKQDQLMPTMLSATNKSFN